MEASFFGTPSKRTIILSHAIHDYPGGRTAAIARHVSLVQITCYLQCICTNLSACRFVFLWTNKRVYETLQSGF